MAKDELNKMTKAELVKLARSRKLDVTVRMLKAELIRVIKSDMKGKKRKKPSGGKGGRAAGAPRSAVKAKAAGKSRSSPGRKAAKRAGAGTKPKAAGKRIRESAAPSDKIPGARTIRQMAESGKYYLGSEAAITQPLESIEIPKEYGIDRIVAMVRDPHWLFTYWEVTTQRYDELERMLKDEWPQCKTILLIYDGTKRKKVHSDIEPGTEARNWYINVPSGRRFVIAVGILSPDGRFIEIARSNTVETPSGTVSDVVDDRWMVPEEIFERIFAASGGYGAHGGSAELGELLGRRLEEEMGSGAVSSLGSGGMRRGDMARGFRLKVATELILYGETEPDARVRIQGKEVKLRGDGTFSLRFALPDGKIKLPVTATSGDGKEERTVNTAVNKSSKEKAPVLK